MTTEVLESLVADALDDESTWDQQKSTNKAAVKIRKAFIDNKWTMLVSGLFGSGKTTTVLRVILEWLLAHKNEHVLFVEREYEAIEEILSYIRDSNSKHPTPIGEDLARRARMELLITAPMGSEKCTRIGCPCSNRGPHQPNQKNRWTEDPELWVPKIGQKGVFDFSSVPVGYCPKWSIDEIGKYGNLTLAHLKYVKSHLDSFQKFGTIVVDEVEEFMASNSFMLYRLTGIGKNWMNEDAKQLEEIVKVFKTVSEDWPKKRQEKIASWVPKDDADARRKRSYEWWFNSAAVQDAIKNVRHAYEVLESIWEFFRIDSIAKVMLQYDLNVGNVKKEWENEKLANELVSRIIAKSPDALKNHIKEAGRFHCTDLRFAFRKFGQQEMKMFTMLIRSKNRKHYYKIRNFISLAAKAKEIIPRLAKPSVDGETGEEIGGYLEVSLVDDEKGLLDGFDKKVFVSATPPLFLKENKEIISVELDNPLVAKRTMLMMVDGKDASQLARRLSPFCNVLGVTTKETKADHIASEYHGKSVKEYRDPEEGKHLKILNKIMERPGHFVALYYGAKMHKSVNIFGVNVCFVFDCNSRDESWIEADPELYKYSQTSKLMQAIARILRPENGIVKPKIIVFVKRSDNVPEMMEAFREIRKTTFARTPKEQVYETVVDVDGQFERMLKWLGHKTSEILKKREFILNVKEFQNGNYVRRETAGRPPDDVPTGKRIRVKDYEIID